jgi:hypothetical protein
MAQVSTSSRVDLPDEILQEILGNLFAEPVRVNRYSLLTSKSFIRYPISILAANKRLNRLSTSFLQTAFQKYGIEYHHMLPSPEKCIAEPGAADSKVEKAQKAHAAFLLSYGHCFTSVTVYGSWRAEYSFEWFTNLQNLRFVEPRLNAAALSPGVRTAQRNLHPAGFSSMMSEGKVVKRLIQRSINSNSFFKALMETTESPNYHRVIECKVGMIPWYPPLSSIWQHTQPIAPVSSKKYGSSCKIWVSYSRGHILL